MALLCVSNRISVVRSLNEMPTDADSYTFDSRSDLGSTASTIFDDMWRNASTAPMTYWDLKHPTASEREKQRGLERRDSLNSCTSATGAAIEGYLEKRGAWLSGYSTRYICVQSNGKLSYFIKEGSPAPRGVIQLRPGEQTAVAIDSPTDEEAGLFLFNVRAATGTRIWCFRTGSADERNSWISVVNEVCSTLSRQSPSASPRAGTDRSSAGMDRTTQGSAAEDSLGALPILSAKQRGRSGNLIDGRDSRAAVAMEAMMSAELAKAVGSELAAVRGQIQEVESSVDDYLAQQKQRQAELDETTHEKSTRASAHAEQMQLVAMAIEQLTVRHVRLRKGGEVHTCEVHMCTAWRMDCRVRGVRGCGQRDPSMWWRRSDGDLVEKRIWRD